MRVVAVSVLATFLSACVMKIPYDEQMACNLARATVPEVQRGQLGPRDLVEAVQSDPRAYQDAMDGYRQSVASSTVGGIGAAALVAGFVMGFATDPTQQGVRIAGYSIVGGAMAMFGVTLILAFTGSKARQRAARHFLMYANNCGLTQ